MIHIIEVTLNTAYHNAYYAIFILLFIPLDCNNVT